MTNTTISIAHVRALLAEDQLRQALDGLLTLPQSLIPHNTLIQLKGQLTALEQDALRRTETPENIDTRRNQIREGILICTDQWAQNNTPTVQGGIRLKSHAFRLLILGKIILLLFVGFHFYISAFSQGETLTLLGLLSPVLVGYLLTALNGQHDSGLGAAAQKNLPFLRGLVYIGLPLYFVAILWIMQKVPLDEWAFETARNWIVGIELAFGGLVAYLVKTLFD